MGTFGQRLRDLRNSHGISQNELSKHIGVSKSSVNMYERDEREPGFETLEAIADFFNVDMDYLLGRDHYISTSKTSTGMVINITIPDKEFSDSAKPTLIKFVDVLNNADSPDFSNNIDRIRAEMDATFSEADFNHLDIFLKVLSLAYNKAWNSVAQNADRTSTGDPQILPSPKEEKDTIAPAE